MLYEISRLFFYAAVAFLLGTLFRSSVIPLVATLFLVFSENIIMMLLQGYKWAKFLFVFHLSPSVYDSNALLNNGLKPPFSDFTLITSILLLIVYIAVFLFAAATVFRKRDIL
jgi:ABC-2 type transport system permease protein